jgi:DNA-binding response OmpR family regulator
MHNPPRILVVDDNETNRDILETRLTASGYEVVQAADGEEALFAARNYLPDLILLDIMMPKINGIDVCRELKSDSTLPFMPIVLLTAKADTNDVVAGLDAGADEYLTKPVEHAALLARVRALLRLKALQDKKQEPISRIVGTDIFISYSHQDRSTIERLAAALQQEPLSVWWDRHIETGRAFDREIEDAISNARSVIVAWSRNSVESDWVRAEAAYALEKKKLLPIRLDNSVPPLRFFHIQTIDLTTWDGSNQAHAYRQLATDIVKMVKQPANG